MASSPRQSAVIAAVLAGAAIAAAVWLTYLGAFTNRYPIAATSAAPQQEVVTAQTSSTVSEDEASNVVTIQQIGPRPAPTVMPGPPSGLTNPSSIGFSPPPPAARTSTTNSAGVVRMVSPALGLDHYIERIGVTNGQMQSPDADGSYVIGWYSSDDIYRFGSPGQPGNSVFSAHETWQHLQGPFYNTHQARVGDDIYLDMADGERRRYQVIRVARYPAATLPMTETLWPSERPKHEEWLTLYTCGGRIVYDGTGYGDYLERDVITAAWVGWPTEPGHVR